MTIGIDPGPTQSALVRVEFDPFRVWQAVIVPNAKLRDLLVSISGGRFGRGDVSGGVLHRQGMEYGGLRGGCLGTSAETLLAAQPRGWTRGWKGVEMNRPTDQFLSLWVLACAVLFGVASKLPLVAEAIGFSVHELAVSSLALTICAALLAGIDLWEDRKGRN